MERDADPPVDAGRRDAGAPDAGALDSGNTRDAGTDAGSDAGPDAGVDAFVPSPPTLEVLFPAATAWSHSSTITVHGTAEDADSLASVTVSGVHVTALDGLLEWESTVDLSPGWNDIAVVATDALGAIGERTVRVLHEPAVADPFGGVYDASSATAYFIDRREGVLAYDASGVRRLASSYAHLLDTTLSPVDVGVDAAAGKLYTIFRDRTPLSTSPGLYVADVGTSDWSLLSSDLAPAGGPTFGGAARFAIDPVGDRAFVHSGAQRAVFIVDLNTGARTMLSDDTTPNSNAPLLDVITDLEYDAAHDRVVLTSRSLQSVIAVDATTGERTSLSDSTHPGTPFGGPNALGLSADGDTAYVYDPGLSGAPIVEVDLTTGARTVLPTEGFATTDLRSVLVDDAGGRLLTLSSTQRHLSEVALPTGVRTPISDARFPRITESPTFTDALVEAGELLLTRNDSLDVLDPMLARSSVIAFATTEGATGFALSDRGLFVSLQQNGGARIARIDRAAATIDTFSGDGVPNSDLLFGNFHRDLTASPTSGALYSLEGDRLLAIANDGARSVVSDATTPDGTLPLTSATLVAIDEARGRALVRSAGEPSRLTAVDLATGARTRFSDNASGAPTFAEVTAVGATADGRLWAIDNSQILYELDPATGARSEHLSDYGRIRQRFIESVVGHGETLLLSSGPQGVMQYDYVRDQLVVLYRVL